MEIENRAFKRGDVYMANLGTSIGSVERGYRPVVILQNNIGNFYAPTLIIAPITSQVKRFHSTHYDVPPVGFLKSGSVVLLEQIATIDKRQCSQYLGSFNSWQMGEINERIQTSIGLSIPEEMEAP